MTERINLSVENGTGDLLTRLAGGERKRGQYLADLLRSIERGERIDIAGAELETLKLTQQATIGKVRMLEGKLSILETQFAALMVKRPGE